MNEARAVNQAVFLKASPTMRRMIAGNRREVHKACLVNGKRFTVRKNSMRPTAIATTYAGESRRDEKDNSSGSKSTTRRSSERW